MEIRDITGILALIIASVSLVLHFKKFKSEETEKKKKEKLGLDFKLTISDYKEDFQLGDRPVLGKKLNFRFTNTQVKAIHLHRIKVEFYDQHSKKLPQTWEKEFKSTVRQIKLNEAEELPETFNLTFQYDQEYIDLFLHNSVKIHITESTAHVITSKIFKPEIIP